MWFESFSIKNTAGDSIQFSVFPIEYGQFVTVFLPLPSLFCLVACCLCSTECPPSVADCIWEHFCIRCDLFALYCSCVVSSNKYEHHLTAVSRDKQFYMLLCDRHDGSYNFLPEKAALAFSEHYQAAFHNHFLSLAVYHLQLPFPTVLGSILFRPPQCLLCSQLPIICCYVARASVRRKK